MDIENKLILASKFYKDDIAQRTLISNIPIIGFAIDSILTEKWSKYSKERLEIFNEFLITEFERLEENNVDKDFLNSNEFFDLIVKLIENSIKTRHKERVHLFGKLLKSRCLKGYNSNYDSGDFTNTINELIPRDIIVIKNLIELAEKLKIEKEKSDKPQDFFDLVTIDKLVQKSNIDKSELLYSVSKLIKLGLITEHYASSFEMTLGGNYQITEYMDEFLKILKA